MACLGARLHVDPVTGCYRWTGYHKNGDPASYGMVRDRRPDGTWTVRHVSRVVAERCWGKAAVAGLDVDHIPGRCTYRDCAHPRHLRPLAPAVNRPRTLGG